MPTRIRASQLHSDISGLVRDYTQQLYPNYSDIVGVSGLTVTNSGGVCVIGGYNIYSDGQVQKMNGLTGSLQITGTSGIFTRVSGQTLLISLTGANNVNRLNTLSGDITLVGYGLVDVWPIDSTHIAISGMPITGQHNIYSYVSGGVIRLGVQAVRSLNNQSGALTLIGQGGLAVSGSGSSIFLNGEGINTGVFSLNDINGNITLKSGSDISISSNPYLKEITISYNGHGLGAGNLAYSGSSNYAWFGDANTFQSGNYALINGNSNTAQTYLNLTAINALGCSFSKCTNSTFINTSGGAFAGVTGSTFVNGSASNSFVHPYAFAIGNSMDNSFQATIAMKALCSGGQMKPMRVAKTSYSGIFIPTGTVLVGHIDYAAARYNITDFLASFSLASGIYGRKYFTAQRNTNTAVTVVDQADFFGGNDNYGVFISGGNDASLYVIASGYGSESVIFNASVQFSQFSFDVNYE